MLLIAILRNLTKDLASSRPAKFFPATVPPPYKPYKILIFLDYFLNLYNGPHHSPHRYDLNPIKIQKRPLMK